MRNLLQKQSIANNRFKKIEKIISAEYHSCLKKQETTKEFLLRGGQIKKIAFIPPES